MTTPNNQDRLLSDEELNEEINDISSDWFVERSGKPVLSKRLEANDKYLTRMRDLINTQKRLYAESVKNELVSDVKAQMVDNLSILEFAQLREALGAESED